MAMDGVNTDTIAIEDEHEDSDHCIDDLAFCPKESQGSDEKLELDEEHLSGMAIAKELSRTAAIAGLQGQLTTGTSSEEEDLVLSTQTSEMTSSQGEEASVIDVLALRTCVSELLQPLVLRVDTLSRCVERERKEAREREEHLSLKIMELESAVTHQTQVIEKEKEEAKDREHRLCMRVRDLEKSLSSLSASVEDSFAKIEKNEHTILQQLKSRGKSETTPCTTHCTANSEAEPREQHDRVNSNTKTTTAPAPKTSSEQLNQVSPEAVQKKTQNGTPAGTATADPGALKSRPQHTAPEKDQPTESREHPNEDRQRTPPRPEETYLDAAKKNRTTAPKYAISRSTDPTKKPMQSTTNKPLGKLVGAPRIRRRVFYVGGIAPECSVEDLQQFCEDQCPLIDCRLMPSRRTGTQSAYVEVAETMADKFRSITWPENLYARDWAFKANAESPVAY